MPGRRPDPTAIRIIKGNPQKKPLPKNEPKFKKPDERLTPKEYLGDSADIMGEQSLKIWDIITPDLHGAGVLTKGDYMAAIGLCNTLSDYFEARRMINKGGQFYKDSDGKIKVARWVGRANEAWREALSQMASFGMTPSDRTRIKSVLDDDREEDNPFIRKKA